MKCPRHHEYNPTEGEPQKPISTDHFLPDCVRCWQAYANYQRERADKLQARLEGVENAYVELQQHRDAWRRYAKEGGERPTDYVPGRAGEGE